MKYFESSGLAGFLKFVLLNILAAGFAFIAALIVSHFSKDELYGAATTGTVFLANLVIQLFCWSEAKGMKSIRWTIIVPPICGLVILYLAVIEKKNAQPDA